MEQNKSHNIHKISVHSYSLYFFFFLIGVFLDLIFRVKLFENAVMLPIGFILLVLATLIILWAQVSFVNLKNPTVTREHFEKGPYFYTRHPTHWGIFLLVLGFGFIANAFFVVLLTFLSHIFAKLFFIKKHESAMLLHFGAPYAEYTKLVKF